MSPQIQSTAPISYQHVAGSISIHGAASQEMGLDLLQAVMYLLTGLVNLEAFVGFIIVCLSTCLYGMFTSECYITFVLRLRKPSQPTILIGPLQLLHD